MALTRGWCVSSPSSSPAVPSPSASKKGRPFVQYARRKCLQLYFYFMDRDFGLSHVCNSRDPVRKCGDASGAVGLTGGARAAELYRGHFLDQEGQPSWALAMRERQRGLELDYRARHSAYSAHSAVYERLRHC